MSNRMVVVPNDFSNKVILVAGSAGFIGSHLSEYYLERNGTVLGLDNFLTGSRSNIDLLTKKYKNFHFYECDIVKNLPDFKNQKIDYILSFASPASPIDFDIIPLEIMRVNSEGTMNLLELTKTKSARFLEASTSEVYGDPEIHPQREDYVGHVNTLGPRACYDEAKRFAEALTMTYLRKYNCDTRIIRIFNTYGPRMRPNDGRVIPNFVNQALNNEDITVFGDGSQTRSYCYVTDLVNAINCVLFSSDHTPFNCGNPDEYTVLETAQTIIDLLESKSKIVYRPLPHDDPKRRRPDLTKLQSISDYRPRVSFKEGLKETVNFFKNI